MQLFGSHLPSSVSLVWDYLMLSVYIYFKQYTAKTDYSTEDYITQKQSRKSLIKTVLIPLLLNGWVVIGEKEVASILIYCFRSFWNNSLFLKLKMHEIPYHHVYVFFSHGNKAKQNKWNKIRK